jgi:hypothetical protein
VVKSDILPGSEQPPREPLTRYAGLTGAATLASRLLGLARDQTLAAVFGAGNAMDAFVVAFRIPNLVRDLFAEGAMSAAFVPTFTRELSLHGKEAAFRLGNNVINALFITTGVLVAAGIVFAHPLIVLYAGSFASVPGKLELTERLTRVVLPFLPMVAVAAAAMGMLNSLHHYFIPALSPAMFNIATIVGVLALVPLMPRLGLPPIMAVAIAALAGAAPRGISISFHRRSTQPGAAARARADGPGHDRPRRDAGEPVREHAAGHEPGHRRGVVAHLRIPPHVSADWPVRRVDRHGRTARGVAPRDDR